MPVIEAQRASILVPHDHRHINHEYAFVYCYCSGCVGFEPRGTEVGLAEGKRLADGDPLRIPQAVPAGRPSGCGSRSSHLPFEVSMAEVVRHREPTASADVDAELLSLAGVPSLACELGVALGRQRAAGPRKP